MAGAPRALMDRLSRICRDLSTRSGSAAWIRNSPALRLVSEGVGVVGPGPLYFEETGAAGRRDRVITARPVCLGDIAWAKDTARLSPRGVG